MSFDQYGMATFRARLLSGRQKRRSRFSRSTRRENPPPMAEQQQQQGSNQGAAASQADWTLPRERAGTVDIPAWMLVNPVVQVSPRSILESSMPSLPPHPMEGGSRTGGSTRTSSTSTGGRDTTSSRARFLHPELHGGEWMSGSSHHQDISWQVAQQFLRDPELFRQVIREQERQQQQQQQQEKEDEKEKRSPAGSGLQPWNYLEDTAGDQEAELWPPDPFGSQGFSLRQHRLRLPGGQATQSSALPSSPPPPPPPPPPSLVVAPAPAPAPAPALSGHDFEHMAHVFYHPAPMWSEPRPHRSSGQRKWTLVSPRKAAQGEESDTRSQSQGSRGRFFRAQHPTDQDLDSEKSPRRKHSNS